MTINLADNNPRIAYSVAQGATQQTFAVPFEFFNDADLSVYVDGVLKAEGTDYTITGGDGSTGNVVFVTATPPDVQQVTGATGGSKVVIVRTTALERTSDFSAGADINRAALNEQLDILTAMAADLKDRADRTIQVNPHEIAPSLILPSLDSRKGKVLAFDETTGAVINGPTIAAFDAGNALVNEDIGVTVQAYNAGLQSISGLTTSANQMIYTTASNTYATTSLTTAGRAFLDDASAADQRTTLGLTIGTNVQAWDANLDQIAALTPTNGNFIFGNGTAWTSLSLSAGTGISVSGVTITNTAPDQVISLTAGSNVTITGAYPNFTVASTDTNTTYTAGTGLSLAGTTFSIDSTVATLTGTQTLTNKRVNTRTVAASGTSGTLIINGDTTDLYKAEGLTGAITLDVPSGTPVDGQKLVIRLEDNGTARGITWTTTSGGFRAIGVTLPTSTVATKITYVGCMYNATDSFWDAVALTTQA